LRFTVEQIREIIRRHAGVAPDGGGIRPIPTGKFNDSFRIALPGRDLVLRIAPPDDSVFCFYERRMMRQEPGIHAMLLERTSVPVPRVLAADFSRGSAAEIPGDAGDGSPERHQDTKGDFRNLERESPLCLCVLVVDGLLRGFWGISARIGRAADQPKSAASCTRSTRCRSILSSARAETTVPPRPWPTSSAASPWRGGCTAIFSPGPNRSAPGHVHHGDAEVAEHEGPAFEECQPRMNASVR